MLASIYAAAASARRRVLPGAAGGSAASQRPVISVGNLRVGGTGKTPVVAHVARLLLEMGERPAILSRGYARRSAPDGVVVVSDGQRLRADLDRSGDEPLMLARSVEGAPRAGVRRPLPRRPAGRSPPRRHGARARRRVPAPAARAGDRPAHRRAPRTSPTRGRCRPAGSASPLAAASCAHAVAGAVGAPTSRPARWPRAWASRRRSGSCASRASRGAWTCSARARRRGSTAPVLAVAGIARPERFFAELRVGRLGREADGDVPGSPSLQPRRRREPGRRRARGGRPGHRDDREGPRCGCCRSGRCRCRCCGCRSRSGSSPRRRSARGWPGGWPPSGRSGHGGAAHEGAAPPGRVRPGRPHAAGHAAAARGGPSARWAPGWGSCSTPSTGGTAASRCRTSRRRFRASRRPSGGRIVRQRLRPLRPAAVRVAEVQRPLQGRDAGARRDRGRRAHPRRARAGARRAAVHRALRLLGDQRDRARRGVRADRRAGAPARQPPAARPARADARLPRATTSSTGGARSAGC